MIKEPLFEKLKEILLDQERKETDRRIAEVEKKIDHREELEPRIQPILNDKVQFIQSNFTQLFGPQVTQSIRNQIRESQDEVIEALYPIIGKMIKKYIVKELELFSERVDRRFDEVFSLDNIWANIRAWFTGKPIQITHETELLEPQIDQILVIEQHSGLLMGSYSRVEAIDQDMIAGMLTAIKSFVGDAYNSHNEQLEMVEYETSKLLIRNFKSFYIAAFVRGGLTHGYKNKLDDLILDFAEKVLNNPSDKGLSERVLDEPMRQYFTQTKNADK